MKRFRLLFSALAVFALIIGQIANAQVPELMYYRFHNNTATGTPNFASAPVGTNPALLVASDVFTSGGQFDSCLSGTGSLTGCLNTGWATAMPSNWTISFWLGPNQVDANPSYLWGDVNAATFRCFYGGAAGVNNVLLRGGSADVLITGINPTATVITIVYNGSNTTVYKNGVFFQTFAVTFAPTGSGPFKVGGYGTGASASISGQMDEFRMYNRALSAAEITATWNVELVPYVYDVPDLMYYRFHNNTATGTPNFASAPVGTNPALLVASDVFTSGGQFDSCLSGTGSLTGCLNTGWATAMPANWTISFWLGPNQVDANPSYLWGDVNAATFRCFYGGAAGVNNVLLRGGSGDVLITGINPTATVITIVYNGTNTTVYKNGVFFQTFAVTFAPTGSGPFKVGGYGTGASASISGKMDEFRMYGRALTAAEITATWNQELPILTGVSHNNNSQLPQTYLLSQNYPNPFNPSTNIDFAVPKAGKVNIVIYDLLGKEVATIVNKYMQAGSYQVNFNASQLSSGVYFYKMEAGSFIQTKKMMLIK